MKSTPSGPMSQQDKYEGSAEFRGSGATKAES